MKIEVSNGEILDKYSILEIKLEKITDHNKIRSVETELGLLDKAFKTMNNRSDVDKKYRQLKDINLKLWGIEDCIREKEKQKDFGDEFVQLARSVYYTNDERAKIKYAINQVTDSKVFEEKSYEEYE